MALTKGQIESFSLICFNQVAKARLSYVAKVLKGLQDWEKDKWFYRINAMISVIWLYDPETSTNCLTVSEIQTIMNKLNFELGMNICLEDLPQTNLNGEYDFNPDDFNHPDFN